MHRCIKGARWWWHGCRNHGCSRAARRTFPHVQWWIRRVAYDRRTSNRSSTGCREPRAYPVSPQELALTPKSQDAVRFEGHIARDAACEGRVAVTRSRRRSSDIGEASAARAGMQKIVPRFDPEPPFCPLECHSRCDNAGCPDQGRSLRSVPPPPWGAATNLATGEGWDTWRQPSTPRARCVESGKHARRGPGVRTA
jgi:hypothetical protein